MLRSKGKLDDGNVGLDGIRLGCVQVEMGRWGLRVSLIPIMNVQFVITKLKSISNAISNAIKNKVDVPIPA